METIVDVILSTSLFTASWAVFRLYISEGKWKRYGNMLLLFLLSVLFAVSGVIILKGDL